MKNFKYFRIYVTLMLVSTLSLSAQTDNEKAAQQANNPLANMKALNFHDYYVPAMYGVDDASANTAFIRYAQPIGRVLVRASLPISTVSAKDNYSSGFGDMQIFGAYLFSDPSSGNQFGAGPLVVLPTGKRDVGGSKKVQVGLSAVAFMGSNPAFQYGGLLTWQISVAGDGHYKDVNSVGIQPFMMWQLGKGLYLRSTPLWTYDVENEGVNIPMGLGVGKVVPVNKIVFNLFLEPQYSMYNHKTNSAKYQILTGINMQF